MRKSLLLLLFFSLSCHFVFPYFQEIKKFEVNGLHYVLEHENSSDSNRVSVINSNYTQSEIVIPDFVEYNGNKYPVVRFAPGAFQNSPNLESIIISDNVKILNTNAFDGCSKLKYINIPDKVSKLNLSCFNACSSLEYIVIPASVKEILNNAFSGCSSLKDVVFLNTDPIVNLSIPNFVNVWTLSSNSVKDLGIYWSNRIKFIDCFKSGVSNSVSFSFVNDYSTLVLDVNKDECFDFKLANGAVYNAAKGMVVRKSIDDSRYFFFSLPFDCAVKDIYSSSGLDVSHFGREWFLARYDGLKALDNNGVNWVDIADPDFVLKAGVGYIIGIADGLSEFVDKDGNVSMVFPSAGAVVLDGSQLKAADVVAFDGRPTWNLVGSGLLASVTGSSVFVGDSEIAYISMPNADGKTYSQDFAANFTVGAMSAFFVESKVSGGLSFNDGVAARQFADDLFEDRIVLSLSDSASVVDRVTFRVSDSYSKAYEHNADLNKLLADGTQQLFACVDGHKLAFCAVDYNSIRYHVDLNVSVPDGCEYVLSLEEFSMPGMDVVLVDHATSSRWNFSDGDYLFYHNGDDSVNRFEVFITERGTATDSPAADSLDDVCWSVSDGDLFIDGLPDGAVLRVVDVSGRLVHGADDCSGAVRVKSLASGVYVLNVFLDNDYKSYKFYI